MPDAKYPYFSNSHMRSLDKKASEIADILFSFVENRLGFEINNSGTPSIMAVHLERRGDIPNVGPVFSVCHTYLQNGDVMSDPYMEIVKSKTTGKFYPYYFQQDGIIGGDQNAFVFDNDNNLKGVRTKMQKDHAVFVNMWFRNIASQQSLLKFANDFKAQSIAA